jgi:hypothetical protein
MVVDLCVRRTECLGGGLVAAPALETADADVPLPAPVVELVP